jgi:NTP pyrophosphatase (non-canonical NTP hydrolase)
MPLMTELQELQWKQLQHDTHYHKEIVQLTMPNRVNHMVLHFAKYNAAMMKAVITQDKMLFQKTCVDVLIITTSLANTLNIDLANYFDQYKNCKDINELASKIKNINQESMNSFMLNMIEITGELAKAAESVDRMENFNIREQLQDGTIDMFIEALCGIFMIVNQSIIENISERMIEVEKKSIFFKHQGNYIDGYLSH